MTNREKLIDRLRKLKAMAESAAAIGNQAEAEAFATKVQDLLTEHKVAMSEVDLQEQEADDPLGYHEYHPGQRGFDPFDDRAKKRRVQWIEQLAMTVAEAHFTKMILNLDRSDRVVTYLFVGRQSDVELATYVFTVLGRNGITMAKKEYDRAKREGRDTRDWYKTFLLGYQRAITTRYARERDRLERQLKTAGTSLVPLERAAAEAAAFAAAAFRTQDTKRLNAGGFNLEAYTKGRAHGEAANLRATGLKAGAPAERKLAAAPKALPAGKSNPQKETL